MSLFESAIGENSQIIPYNTPYIELGTRINKYLKENKNQKIIDIKKLISTLRDEYPTSYGKTKKEDFEAQVDKAFKELAGQVAGKKMKEKKKEKEKEKKEGKKGEGTNGTETPGGPEASNGTEPSYGLEANGTEPSGELCHSMSIAQGRVAVTDGLKNFQ